MYNNLRELFDAFSCHKLHPKNPIIINDDHCNCYLIYDLDGDEIELSDDEYPEVVFSFDGTPKELLIECFKLLGLNAESV